MSAGPSPGRSANALAVGLLAVWSMWFLWANLHPPEASGTLHIGWPFSYFSQSHYWTRQSAAAWFADLGCYWVGVIAIVVVGRRLGARWGGGRNAGWRFSKFAAAAGCVAAGGYLLANMPPVPSKYSDTGFPLTYWFVEYDRTAAVVNVLLFPLTVVAAMFAADHLYRLCRSGSVWLCLRAISLAVLGGVVAGAVMLIEMHTTVLMILLAYGLSGYLTGFVWGWSSSRIQTVEDERVRLIRVIRSVALLLLTVAFVGMLAWFLPYATQMWAGQAVSFALLPWLVFAGLLSYGLLAFITGALGRVPQKKRPFSPGGAVE